LWSAAATLTARCSPRSSPKAAAASL
jgi:hypothetical protein